MLLSVAAAARKVLLLGRFAPSSSVHFSHHHLTSFLPSPSPSGLQSRSLRQSSSETGTGISTNSGGGPPLLTSRLIVCNRALPAGLPEVSEVCQPACHRPSTGTTSRGRATRAGTV